MDKRRNHIIFWVCFPLYYGTLTFITLKDTLPHHKIFLSIFLGCSISFLNFYFFVLFLLPKTLSYKKYGLFTLGVITALICSSILHLMCLFLLNKFFPNLFLRETIMLSLAGVVFPVVRAIYLAFPYWFVKQLFLEAEQKKETEQKMFLLLKTVSSSELLSLKNQINPHFFYNILNFLYSQSLPFSSKLSNAILTLSEMMRYAISDNNNTDKVSLTQEIDYVRKYILLENLQRSKPALLAVIGNINFRRIYPMTFQPILENCFKFGIDINFKLEIQENKIHFNSTYIQIDGFDKEEIDSHFKMIKAKMPSEYQENISLIISSEKQLCNLNLYLNT